MEELELLKIIQDYQGSALLISLIIILIIQILKFVKVRKENVNISKVLNKIESNHFGEIKGGMDKLNDKLDSKFDRVIELLIKIEANLRGR